MESRDSAEKRSTVALRLSPLLEFAAGFVLHRLLQLLLRAATPAVNTRLPQSQWVTAATLAFAHDTNDAATGREDFYQTVTPNLSLGLTCCAHRMG